MNGKGFWLGLVLGAGAMGMLGQWGPAAAGRDDNPSTCIPAGAVADATSALRRDPDNAEALLKPDADADGIPGKTSLTELGRRFAFTVVGQAPDPTAGRDAGARRAHEHPCSRVVPDGDA